MVSVNERNHNEIVWKQTDEVASYNLYKEADASGEYDLIANVDESQNRWIDTTVNASTRSYSYRIAAIDTCGNESELSEIHKTIHLTISEKETSNAWRLTWTPYEGLPYSTYNIYRATGDNSNHFEFISTAPSDSTSYTDVSAPEGYVYYRIEIEMDEPCDITSSIKSNIVSGKPTGIVEAHSRASFRIYPNPTTGQLKIESGKWKVENVEVFDMTGRKQQTEIKAEGNEIEVNISHLSAGMYLVKVGNVMKKVVKRIEN